MGCLLLVAGAPIPAMAATGDGLNWPQWRGPGGSGVSEEKDLPLEWNETKNIQWKTAIPGRGHSSPVVWGNRIFLTTSIEGEVVPGAKAPVHLIGGEEFLHPDSVGADHSYALKVLALDRDTGKVLWEETAYEGTVYDNRHRRNTYASATPVTDGRALFAYLGPAGLLRLRFRGQAALENTTGPDRHLWDGCGNFSGAL